MISNSKRIIIVLLLSSIILAGIVAGTVTLPNDSDAINLTKKTYGIGEIIEGYVSFNLTAQSSQSNLRMIINNREQNVSLLNFLVNSGLDSSRDFLCDPKNCENTYQTSDTSSVQKILPPGANMIGVMIVGNNVQIKSNSLKFDVRGENSTTSCGKSPLMIDILADKIIDWQYLEGGSDFCEDPYGSTAYNPSAELKNFDITTDGYCEKISLTPSNKFALSAIVKKTEGEGDLTMFLYDRKTGNSAQCDLEEPNQTGIYINKSCIVNFDASLNLSDQDYYVCIRDELTDNGYAIQGEAYPPFLGNAGLPEDNNATADFALLVQGAEVLPFNKTITFNDTEFEKMSSIDLSRLLQDYVTEKYEGNCLSGCLIPIEITSEKQIVVNSLAMGYTYNSGLRVTEQKFFKFKTKPASINMNMTTFPLENAHFSLENATIGSQIATLFIDDQKIGNVSLLVDRVPIIRSIQQIGQEALAPMQFAADAYSPKGNIITSYKWNFGDGNVETTTEPIILHTYQTIGIFKLKLEVTDSEGLMASKTKNVSMGSPKEILNKSIAMKKEYIKNVTSKIDASPAWYKDVLTKNTNLAEISDKLTRYERQYNLARTDAEYLDLMMKISEINTPKEIDDYETTPEFSLVNLVDSIAPEYIEKLKGGTYDTNYPTETRNAIGSWNCQNLNISVNGKVLGALYEDGSTEEIVTIINLKINPQIDLNEIFFVIMYPFEKIKFDSEYGQQQLDGATGFTFENFPATEEKDITFALPGRIEIPEIVAFGSPYLADLPIKPLEITCDNDGTCDEGENWKNCRPDCKPIGLAIFLILLVLVVMVGVYFILQQWYRTKYESYLFKNKQDLKNIIFYIKNALSLGKSEKEIKEELKKAGWTGEQIEYASKKVKGKPLGLPNLKFKLKEARAQQETEVPKA